jgi:integrase
VPSVYTADEVEKIIDSASQSVTCGKRNLAIILIIARLGLRSCDVANLKFENIYYDRGTIEITQLKTKKSLTLPLLPEIRDALNDYFANERPKSGSINIFVRVVQPFGTPLMPKSMYMIVSRIIESTDIDIRGRRHGPHALRASLATALLDEGHNYQVIQQVLGQESPDAAKSYVKVDIEHLRAYALPVPQPAGNFAKMLRREVSI